jgi:hypothetical protein
MLGLRVALQVAYLERHAHLAVPGAKPAERRPPER